MNAKVENKNTEKNHGKTWISNEIKLIVFGFTPDRQYPIHVTAVLVIGGTIFQHLDVHKLKWKSPDDITINQIDRIMINKKLRR